MKRSLVLIDNAHNLYEFLWYYCTYGKDEQWDAIWIYHPLGNNDFLEPLCKKLNIFNNIYKTGMPFKFMSLPSKLLFFFKMLIYALFKKQKSLARTVISKYVKIDNYDKLVVLTDYTILAGMFLLFGKEKEVVILEDGIGDYRERKVSNIFKNFYHFRDLQGFFTALLGYANIGYRYPLRTTKNCYKFSTYPEKMKYKKYKNISKLFDIKTTDMLLFKKLLLALYPNLEKYFKEKIDLILFTTNFSDSTKDIYKYVHKIENYINSNYSSIILKKHYKDIAEYSFSKTIKCVEIDKNIPGEVLLPYLSNCKIIFCDFSSINLYIQSFNYEPYFFYFNELRLDNEKELSLALNYLTQEEFIKFIQQFGFSSKNIINL